MSPICRLLVEAALCCLLAAGAQPTRGNDEAQEVLDSILAGTGASAPLLRSAQAPRRALSLEAAASSVHSRGRARRGRRAAAAAATGQREVALLRAKLTELRSRGRASAKYEAKLVHVLRSHDLLLHHAQQVMQRELAAAGRVAKEESAAQLEAQKERAKVVHLQEALKREQQQRRSAEKQLHAQEVLYGASNTAATELRSEMKAFQDKSEKQAKSYSAGAAEAQREQEQANAKIARLENVVNAMQSEVAGGIVERMRLEKNVTESAREVQQAKVQLSAMEKRGQASETNSMLTLSKWKETLAQLRGAVEEKAKIQEASATRERELQADLDDARSQLKRQGASLTDLQEQVDEASVARSMSGVRRGMMPTAGAGAAPPPARA